MQILEDGTLTDAKGRKVDFSNTIIIMTSNLGADKLQREVSLGFRVDDDAGESELHELHEKNTDKVKDDLKKFMRPELLNRIDKIIVFRALSKRDIRSIVDTQLTEFSTPPRQQKLAMRVTPKAKDWLLDNGYDVKNGVRPLRRLIQDAIEDRIAEGILKGEYEPAAWYSSIQKRCLELFCRARVSILY